MAFFYLYAQTAFHWKAGFKLKGEKNAEEKSSACPGLTPTLDEDMDMLTGRAWEVLLSPKVQISPKQENSQKAEREGQIQRVAKSLGPTLCMLTAQWAGITLHHAILVLTLCMALDIIINGRVEGDLYNSKLKKKPKHIHLPKRKTKLWTEWNILEINILEKSQTLTSDIPRSFILAIILALMLATYTAQSGIP